MQGASIGLLLPRVKIFPIGSVSSLYYVPSSSRISKRFQENFPGCDNFSFIEQNSGVRSQNSVGYSDRKSGWINGVFAPPPNWEFGGQQDSGGLNPPLIAFWPEQRKRLRLRSWIQNSWILQSRSLSLLLNTYQSRVDRRRFNRFGMDAIASMPKQWRSLIVLWILD
jgi:hypothetical protein